jgi:hypothetical protein
MDAQVSSASETMRSTGIALRLKHTFAAAREKVFRAWLDPETIRQWFVCNAEAQDRHAECLPYARGSPCRGRGFLVT